MQCILGVYLGIDCNPVQDMEYFPWHGDCYLYAMKNTTRKGMKEVGEACEAMGAPNYDAPRALWDAWVKARMEASERRIKAGVK